MRWKRKAVCGTETPPDFVFFDLTGTVNNMGLIKTVATMDYIFCPIAADRFIMESSLKYAGILNDTLVTTGKSNIKGIRLLWNMVDRREKTDLYDIYEKVIAGMGLEVLKTSLPDSKRFRQWKGAEEGEPPAVPLDAAASGQDTGKGQRHRRAGGRDTGNSKPLNGWQRNSMSILIPASFWTRSVRRCPRPPPRWRTMQKQMQAENPQREDKGSTEDPKDRKGKGRGISGTLPEPPRKFRYAPARQPIYARATTSGYSASCQVIGKNGLTLSVYVDRVLEEHFREYEEVIRKLYKKSYEDIY